MSIIKVLATNGYQGVATEGLIVQRVGDPAVWSVEVGATPVEDHSAERAEWLRKVADLGVGDHWMKDEPAHAGSFGWESVSESGLTQSLTQALSVLREASRLDPTEWSAVSGKRHTRPVAM